MASVDRGRPRVLQQDFKRALRGAYQVRREQGLTVSRALHDAVDEVWTALIKPLAVIDADDREDVERFREIASRWADQVPHSLMRERGDMDHTDAMQAALRQFAAPTPQIEEPMGLGAVVETANGDLFVRSKTITTVAHWKPAKGGERRKWEHLRVVRVLSEGIEVPA